MLFTTDKQTLDDLNIFGRNGGTESIYNIFNHCATKGGAVVLEEMFRYPLSDETAINKRSGIIQHFAVNAIVFPFQSTHFDAVEPYINNHDERSRLSAEEQSIGKRLGGLIAPDIETARLVKGITMLTEMLQLMRDFINSPGVAGGHCYLPDRDAIADLLAQTAFIPVLESKGKLPHAMIIAFDSILRFQHRDIIKKILDHIYQLDVYLSAGRVALKYDFVFPKALPGNTHLIKLDGLYHPLVNNAVPNSIDITPENNLLFLTGANMAGKSTFMKSLSIALFLAHMGFPVAAKRMEFSVLDGIYTTINLPDNLGMGASHFYAEVLRVKKIALELSRARNLFIVFDELFRGTNVKDAYEATIAIAKAFAAKRNSVFLISTHIIEAGEVLKQCNNIRFLYLPTRMDGNKPVYTYKLENGITDDRHGMVIIKNEGILDILEAGIIKKT